MEEDNTARLGFLHDLLANWLGLVLGPVARIYRPVYNGLIMLGQGLLNQWAHRAIGRPGDAGVLAGVLLDDFVGVADLLVQG